ncbi:MAG: hypothetical protein RL128_979, partial [Pseudomonadota bacterium]
MIRHLFRKFGRFGRDDKGVGVRLVDCEQEGEEGLWLRMADLRNERCRF